MPEPVNHADECAKIHAAAKRAETAEIRKAIAELEVLLNVRHTAVPHNAPETR
jgi:hypothetical protein